MSIVIPPFEGLDEGAHYLRVVSISSGGVLPVRPGRSLSTVLDTRGGMVDPAAADVETSFARSFSGNPHFRIGDVARHFRTPASNKSRYAVHSNTAIYPPQLYLPQAVAVALARLMRAPPLSWLYVARLTGALAVTFLLWAAMITSPSATPSLMLMSVLPMTIFQAAVLSNDSLLLGFTFLFAAGLRRMIENKTMTFAVAISFAVSTIMVSSGKIAYVGFALLPVIALNRRSDWKRHTPIFGAAAAGVCLFALWSMMIRNDIVTVRRDIISGPAEQLAWLMSNKAEGSAVLLDCALRDLPNLILMMFGRYITFAFVAIPRKLIFLELTIATVFLLRRAISPHRGMFLAFIAVCAVSYMAITTMLYLQWTAVGAHQVEGVQGRYLLPLFFVLLAVPGSNREIGCPKLINIFYAIGLLLPVWEVLKNYWL